MSRILEEMCDQPAAMYRLLKMEKDRSAAIGRRIAAAKPEYVIIAARGSSDNVARYAQYLFGTMLRLPVALALPSLFTLAQSPVRMEKALVIGISQSGASPDVVSVVAEARRQNAITLAVTNDESSPLAMTADNIINLHTGPEKSIAATKTYMNSLGAIAMVIINCLDDIGFRKTQYQALLEVPDAILRTIETADVLAEKIAEKWLAGNDRAVVIGRGYHYATAFEAALKLKELSYITAEPYSSADFKHGPVAMIERDFPVLAFTGNSPFDRDVKEFAAFLKEKQANVVTIGTDECDINYFNGLRDWLEPFPAVVCGQLISYYLAVHKLDNVDKPRNLEKVTRTT